MTIGPVSYTVIAFPGNRSTATSPLRSAKLVANGTVRILDLVFVGKDEEGDTISLEFDQMDELAAFGDLDGEVGGLVNVEDLDHVAANLPEGNSALVIVWEDLWADAAGRGGARVGRRGGRLRPHPGRPGRGGARRAGRRRSRAENRQRPKNERERSRTCHMGRRPVLRTVGRTAVIAGTASVGGGRGQPPPAAEVRGAGQRLRRSNRLRHRRRPRRRRRDSDELINKLKELANLKDQGILTEAEFNDQKAKILAQM